MKTLLITLTVFFGIGCANTRPLTDEEIDLINRVVDVGLVRVLETEDQEGSK